MDKYVQQERQELIYINCIRKFKLVVIAIIQINHLTLELRLTKYSFIAIHRIFKNEESSRVPDVVHIARILVIKWLKHENLYHNGERITNTTQRQGLLIEAWQRRKRQKQQAGRQKIASLILMQFLNDIIKSRYGFKTAQKFHKFLIKTKFMKFLSSFKAIS